MSLTTLKEQLSRVREAIKAIEGGAQEYSIGQRTVSKGDLATLYKREEKLERKIEREEYGSRTLAGFDS